MSGEASVSASTVFVHVIVGLEALEDALHRAGDIEVDNEAPRGSLSLEGLRVIHELKLFLQSRLARLGLS